MLRAILAAALVIAYIGLAMGQSAIPPAPPHFTPMGPQPYQRSAQAPTVIFKSAACQGMADGGYCGLADNHQQYFECHAGAIVAQRPCPGGCDQRTLECRQSTGVKPIDRQAPK